MPFVHLHVHTGFSFHQSTIRIDRLVAQCVDLGFRRCAVTDTNTLAGAIRFYRAARAASVIPILGCELTIHREETDDAVILLARDLAGYSNLCRLVTCAQQDREHMGVSMEQLGQHTGGVIALYGAPGSVLYHMLGQRQERQAETLLQGMRAVFGDNLYLDVQNPLRMDSQRMLYRCRQLSRATGVPACATGGVTHLVRADAEVREMLAAIGDLEDMDARSRHTWANAESWFHSDDGMRELFADWQEPVDASGRLAEACNVDLPMDSFKTPAATENRSLHDLVWMGAREKYGTVTREVQERLDHELAVIDRLHLEPYFLIVWDIVALARQKGIAYAGRGSAANSVVCYCLDATQVDPIANGLLFERFLNEGRTSLPDVDIDFDAFRRDELIAEILRMYGEDRACRVANVNTYNIRGAFRDVGKALGYSPEEVDEATRMLPWYTSGSLQETIAALPELSAFPYGAVEHWVSLAQRIMGLPRTLSTHLAGVIIAPFPLTDLVPLQPSDTGCLISQYDKDDVDRMGLVKMDLLALRTLSAAVDATAMIRADTGNGLTLATIPLDDDPTYRLIRAARTVGCFQLESPGERSLLLKLQPVCATDLAITVSLFRPGPMQLHLDQLFLARRNGREPVTYDDPRLEPVLRDTCGVIVWQEQVLQVAHAVADLSYAEADVLRRAMTEKTPKQELQRFEQLFLERAQAKGTDPGAARRIFEQLKAFAAYGFCRGHAAAFSLLGWRTAYLKAHWPAYYFAGLMNALPVGFYPAMILLDEARRCGVLVEKPSITRSAVHALAHGRTLLLGFNTFTVLPRKDAEAIVTAREQQPFASLQDFQSRVRVNRRALRHLVLAGAFDEFGTPTAVAEDLGLGAQQVSHVLSAARDSQTAAIFGETAGIGYPVSVSLAQLLDACTVEVLDPPTQKQLRASLLTSSRLVAVPNGCSAWVRGIVIRIQTPPTHSGKRVFFVTLEDEEGMIEAVMFEDVQRRYAAALKSSRMLRAFGEVQNAEGSPTLVIARVEQLRFDVSRDSGHVPVCA